MLLNKLSLKIIVNGDASNSEGSRGLLTRTPSDMSAVSYASYHHMGPYQGASSLPSAGISESQFLARDRHLIFCLSFLPGPLKR